MQERDRALSRDSASDYILENFEPSDRLATVLLNKRSNAVIQRLATAEKIAAPDFQAWLRHQNARRWDVYISMNAVGPDARGRTKADIAAIRHVYLDFDEDGTQKVEAVLKGDHLPKPNFLLNTSRNKWQVVWKVEGFTKDQAEALQTNLARETGADPAATDCARVLRLPGFYNHKYAHPHLIRAEALSSEVYGPDRFPRIPEDARGTRRLAPAGESLMPRKHPPGQTSQSEHDWAYAKRALARGESPEVVVAAIASHRRYDKHNPKYYAELTVKNASESLRTENSRAASADIERT